MANHHKTLIVKTKRLLGLFGDFDEAFEVIADISRYKVPGLTVDDVTLKSPIEHPEIEDVLGERPSNVPKFAFWGGLFGLVVRLFVPRQRSSQLLGPAVRRQADHHHPVQHRVGL